MVFLRIKHAIKDRTTKDILRLVWKNLIYSLLMLTPWAYRARMRDRAFDQTWGTDTSGTWNLSSLQVDRELARHGVRYQASDSDRLLTVLDAMMIPFSDFSFVDYGSGKGRIVLTASLRPFRQVYGVEFAPELVSIAKQNLEEFRRREGTTVAVHLICGNAAEFDPPPENLICYFYNPFDETVMKKVVGSLESALETRACDIRVIYVDPTCRFVFECSGRWVQEVIEDVLVISARSGT